MEEINDIEYNIIIPRYDNSGRKIKSEELEGFAKKMANHFRGDRRNGSVTIIPSIIGCWKPKNSDKLICKEKAIISSVRDTEDSPKPLEEQRRDDENFVEALSKQIGLKTGQYSIRKSKNRVEVDFVGGNYQHTLPQKMLGQEYFKRLI